MAPPGPGCPRHEAWQLVRCLSTGSRREQRRSRYPVGGLREVVARPACDGRCPCEQNCSVPAAVSAAWTPSIANPIQSGACKNWGASSPMISQCGLFSTQMWPRTPTFGFSSISPAGTTHIFSHTNLGSGDPQSLQNVLPQPSGRSNCFALYWPESHSKFSGRIQNTAFEPVPDTFLHFVQWHFPTGPESPLISNTHFPHRQVPFMRATFCLALVSAGWKQNRCRVSRPRLWVNWGVAAFDLFDHERNTGLHNLYTG